MRSSNGSTSVFLLVLVLLYLLLTAVILFFFQQVLLNITSEQNDSNTLALVALIAFPVLLLGFVVYNMLRLFRERTQKKPGSRYKIRLIMFFSFVALLSALPQSALSTSFLNSVINSEIIGQIDDAWKLAIDFYEGKVNNLKTFGSSPILPRILQMVDYNPEKIWESVKSINPEIHFLQVLDRNGNELNFLGSREGQVRMLLSQDVQQGMLPKIDRVDVNVTLLRYLYIARTPSRTSYLIFGIAIPKSFNDKAKQLAQSKDFFEELRQSATLKTFIIVLYFFFSIPILLLSIIISFYLSEEVVRPIIHLEEATRRVAQGDMSIRILTRSNDELGNLIDSFNLMVGELDSSKKKLQKSEKIAAWQEIAQRLAHEIKNPLTPIRLAAERIRKKYNELREAETGTDSMNMIIDNSVQAIITEVNSLDKLLREFNDFAKLPDPSREQVNLKALVDEVISAYAEMGHQVEFSSEGVDGKILLMIDRNQFRQVFANLFMNALHAMPDGGKLQVRADLVKKEKTNYCRIEVRDTGTGIDENVQPHIFNPYFTTKKGGTGLGLSIVERIVFDHDGNIWFESRKDSGTAFFIDLPMETL
ncbi:MAG: HAMP domain-containing protein [Spirochaetaceae bacterium]|nr:MAG: HAMP domain-containing protein [Spirochaetaceae bacterium]